MDSSTARSRLRRDPGGLPPLESVEGSQIKQASSDYGIEFVGRLPDPVQ
jgi:hypothetical protein